MVKTIIKEIVIVLLLILVIALILGILFYNYIPNSKTIPVKVKEYAIAEDIKEEIDSSLAEEKEIVKTYYIDSKDVKAYESKKDHEAGKVNPFSSYISTDEKELMNKDENNTTENKINEGNLFNTVGK